MSSTDLETLYSDSVALCQQGRLFDALTLLDDALQLAGLPVLTFPTGAFVVRYGASVSVAVGLNELIVPDLETYAARAVAFATNRNDDLHLLRQCLA